MDPRGGEPATPASPEDDAEDLSAWPEDADSPAESRWRRARILGRYEDFLRCSVDWLWETDAELVLTFVSSPVALKLGIPAQVLLGRPLPSLGRFEAGAPGAATPTPLDRLRPFRDAAFVMTGAEQREVPYRLSGVPYFDEEDGRFAGFRGTAVAAAAPESAEAEGAERAAEVGDEPGDEALAVLSRLLEETLLRNADLEWRLSQTETAEPAEAPAAERPVSDPPEAEAEAEPETAESDPSPLRRTAHELRTPLNAVMGYADLGLSQVFGPLGERYLDCFRTIKEAGRHMDELVAQLQATARRPESAALAVEIVDIAAAVAKAKAMIALAAREAEVDLSRVGPMAGGQVVGDRRACTQVLLNLLSNAVKFTPPGGSVGLETVAGPNGNIQIVVWDSGVGISLEEQQRIFEPEYRGAAGGPPGGIQDRIPGHGLGLAISRDLARAMGGELGVISQPGQGSRFILSLPSAGRAPLAR